MATEWMFKRKGCWVGDFLPKLIGHQRQGTLDGACGFYCVSMILDYFEVCTPEVSLDGRSRLAKYLTSITESPLLRGGLLERELRRVEEFFPGAQLTHDQQPATDFNTVLQTVHRWVSEAKPGILRYSYRDGRDVGAQYVVTVGTGERSIYLMDPGLPAAEGSLYNNYITNNR
jgi:hypothetical protein